MNPDRERELKSSWAANAEAWTRAVRDGVIESRTLATDTAVIDAVLESAPLRVLDVGTGEGWLAHRLAERGVDVVGFDASDALIARAREGAGSFHVLDYDAFAREPAVIGDAFDVVVCNFSLLGDPIHALLRALRSVIAPAGRLVIQTLHPLAAAEAEPYADGWRVEDFRRMPDGFDASMPWFFRTVGSWIGVLRSTGFRVEECREPVHPTTGQPLSIVWIARPDASAR